MSTPSTSRSAQSKKSWYQATSSVWTTAAPGTVAASRATSVDLPEPLRPSTASTRGPSQRRVEVGHGDGDATARSRVHRPAVPRASLPGSRTEATIMAGTRRAERARWPMAVAVITGVSRRIGIGAAVARRLAEAGRTSSCTRGARTTRSSPGVRTSRVPRPSSPTSARGCASSTCRRPRRPRRARPAPRGRRGRVRPGRRAGRQPRPQQRGDPGGAHGRRAGLLLRRQHPGDLLLVKEFAARCPAPGGWCS